MSTLTVPISWDSARWYDKSRIRYRTRDTKLVLIVLNYMTWTPYCRLCWWWHVLYFNKTNWQNDINRADHPTRQNIIYINPADTRRNNNVIITSKRRRGVILTPCAHWKQIHRSRFICRINRITFITTLLNKTFPHHCIRILIRWIILRKFDCEDMSCKH